MLAAGESGIAMRRGDSNEQRRFTSRHESDAVMDQNETEHKFFAGIFRNSLEFNFRHFNECLIFDSIDRLSVLHSSHDSKKIDQRSIPIGEFRVEAGQRLRRQFYVQGHHQRHSRTILPVNSTSFCILLAACASKRASVMRKADPQSSAWTRDRAAYHLSFAKSNL